MCNLKRLVRLYLFSLVLGQMAQAGPNDLRSSAGDHAEQEPVLGRGQSSRTNNLSKAVKKQVDPYRAFKVRSSLDSQSLADYGDYLERRHHHLRLGPGLKFYSGAATGHPLGQDQVTADLIAELRRHWLEGTQTRTHKIFRALSKTRFHVIPNNLSVKSENGGSHWMLILVDVKSAVIECYDSYGRKPCPFIIKRMEALAKEFSRLTLRDFAIENTKVAHQSDSYNCGAYLLHYASLRAAGLSAEQIETLDIDISGVRKQMYEELVSQNLSYEASILAKLPRKNQGLGEAQIDAARAALGLGDFSLASVVRNMKPFEFTVNIVESESPFVVQVRDYRDLFNYLRRWSIPDYKVDKLLDEGSYLALLEKYGLDDQRQAKD